MFTEGQNTEPYYLTAWHRLYSRSVQVKIAKYHGPPRELVDRAVEAKKLEDREERAGRGRAHDEIWCVFDVDQHPKLTEALQVAAAHGIHVAISNPCIELWFVLHFQDQTASLTAADALRQSKRHLGCGKNLTNDAVNSLVDCFDDARDRAAQLDAKHVGDASPPHANPSSSVWELIESIRRDHVPKSKA